MTDIFKTAFLVLLLWNPLAAQTSPEAKVESYFKALLDNRLDLALQSFGVKAEFTDSQKAVLSEYKLVDPSSVGRCETSLKVLGKALAGYSELHGGYPPQLSALVPHSLKTLPHCPTAPEAPYNYQRRDAYFYLLSCPTGHGRTPGFPKFSPIDGVLPNPNLKLLTYYKVLEPRKEDGLTKIKVLGASPKGTFERDFVFTPGGGFVSGDFSKEVERLLQAMTKTSVPSATELDSASLLLGVAVFKDQELIRAAHCRLLQEKLYYKILGVQTRLGEKSFEEVAKHLSDIPKCPTSQRVISIRKQESGRTLLFCPGTSHSAAGLEKDQPSREF